MFMLRDVVSGWWRGSGNQQQQQLQQQQPLHPTQGLNGHAEGTGYLYGLDSAEDIRINMEYFCKLEETHGLKMGELSTFYLNVNDWFGYQIMACLNSPDDFSALVTTYIDRYLVYLYMYPEDHVFNMPWVTTGPNNAAAEIVISLGDDAPTVDATASAVADTITFPCLFYVPAFEDAESHCLALDGDDCQTYMVNARLDLVYSTIYERALIDILRRRNTQMWHGTGANIADDRLHMIDDHARYYREQMTYTYKGSGSEAATPNYQYDRQQQQQQPPLDDFDRALACAGSETQSTTTSSTTTTTTTTVNTHQPYDQRRQSHEMVIYTKRGSAFYRRCCELLYGDASASVVAFSTETARTASIPFQQVLLMCGQQPGFQKRHCQQPQSPDDTCVTVTRADASDWVVVPVWHYLLWKVATASK